MRAILVNLSQKIAKLQANAGASIGRFQANIWPLLGSTKSNISSDSAGLSETPNPARVSLLSHGDLLATGTVSGPDAGSEGCLLEKRHNAEPIRLPGGETRTWLEDGDRVTLRAYAQKPGLPRIGFGLCSGTVSGAVYE